MRTMFGGLCGFAADSDGVARYVPAATTTSDPRQPRASLTPLRLDRISPIGPIDSLLPLPILHRNRRHARQVAALPGPRDESRQTPKSLIFHWSLIRNR